ncbi:MAG: flagellar motor switch protein FliG [Treponema sp.]|nr:flagellar motor switch protein FliG [Treponema sp.]
MNLNDMRANAYKNAGAKSEPQKPQKPQNVKAFVPPRIQKIEKTDSVEKVEKFEKIGLNTDQRPYQAQEQSQEKPLFKDVNKQVGKILETQTTDYLKSGGLIKVPVSQKESDGKDSVYRRVAKFLLIIGVDEAAKILPHLSQEQTEKIIPEIASIRSVEPEEAEVILAEFKGLLERSRESGGKETARTILEKAYGPEKAEELLNKTAAFAGTKPFEYLNDADTERVFYLLNDESEQIRALVLSHLEPKKAASVINLMEPEAKKEVVKRLAKMEPVNPEVLRRVDQAMHEKSLAQTTEKAENIDGRNALAEILKKMTPSAENDILKNLAEDDPELGQDLRSRLFTIEDVVNADDRFIQEQLREMDDSAIAMLITSKPDDFVEKILSCISAGRRAAVREEQNINAPYKRSDCERITSSFFSVMRRAFEDGKLIIKGRNDEVYV